MILFLASCSKDVNLINDDISEEAAIAPFLNEDITQDDLLVFDEDAITGDSLASRSAWTKFYDQRATIGAGNFYGRQISKNYLSGYEFRMVVSPVSGNPDAYVYGLTSNGWQYRKGSSNPNGTDSVIITSSDMNPSDSHIGFYTYGQTNTTFDYRLYYRPKSEDSYTIQGYDSNPTTGIVNSTNFYFRVDVNGAPTSNLTGTVEFIAPDGMTYNSTMYSANGHFFLYKTLQQHGFYSYKYKVGNQTTQSRTLLVEGDDCSSISVPIMGQEFAYSCGATSSRAFAQAYGYSTTFQDWYDILGTGVSSMTDRQNAIHSLTNLRVKVRYNASSNFDELKELVCQTQPVLVDIYLWNYPHTVCVTRITDTQVYFNDPYNGGSQTIMSITEFIDLWDLSQHWNTTYKNIMLYTY